MAKPQKNLQEAGEIIENPIISNFKEGLDVVEYFISTHGARKGLADTALKTADAGYLTRRLVDVAQDIIITEEDCGTIRGIVVSENIKENNEIIELLSDRVLGRISVNDIIDPINKNIILSAGEEITDKISEIIKSSSIEELEIRSVLTCESKNGICIKCYGRNLATDSMVQIGEAIGVIAAQSIGEPGTQLTLRTFHVGGTASNVAVETKIKSKFDGKVIFEDIKFIKTKNKEKEDVEIVLGRSGEIKIIDFKSKKILSNYHVPYSAYLKVKEGAKIKKGEDLFHWDPYNAVIISSKSGKVKFESIKEGITYREEYDNQTGHKEKVIIEPKDKRENPSIIIEDKNKKNNYYNLPVGAHIFVKEGEVINSGQILAKIPRIMNKSRDITGGLPRVTELFEARNPSNPAIVSEIDGIVIYGKINKRGNREITIKSKELIEKKYSIPLSKHILVQDNDYIKAGYPLSGGAITPADILSIKGPTVLQEYLVQKIQEIYRLQGVKINDKHIEIIARQMMQKVEIVESGDTGFLLGQIVNKFLFREKNDKIFDKKIIIHSGDSQIFKIGQIISLRKLNEENINLKQKKLKIITARSIETAISKPKLQGITQSSLGTDSFMSAASFQETTKILSEASIWGKEDNLKGLKENVIIGHLIPAGTGIKKYQDLIVGSKKEYNLLFNK